MAYAADIGEMREMLSSIVYELTSDQKEELKFLFQCDLKEKDKNNDIFDIFDRLEEQNIIYLENMKPLEVALGLMQRKDLIEKIDTFYKKNKRDIPLKESHISEFTIQLYKLGQDMAQEKVKQLAFEKYKLGKYKNVWELLTLLVEDSVLEDLRSIEKVRRRLRVQPFESNKRPTHLQPDHSSDTSSQTGENLMALTDVPDSPLFSDNSLSQSVANDSSSQSNEEPVAGDKDGQHYNTTAKKMSITEMNEYFKEDNELCSGAEGTVYKGCKQYNDCDVVVKVLHKEKESFKMELISYRKKHPFLLPLLAYCEENQEENGQCILMFPHMKNRDLEVHLKDVWDKKAELLFEDCVRIVYQVYVGLKFLHRNDGNNRKRILHRDVKAANILLDDMLNARLGGPGIAKELGGKTHVTITSSFGTPGYIDPDVICAGEFRPINDVFGLGVGLMVSGIDYGEDEKNEKNVFESDVNEILENKHIIGVSSDNITVIRGNAGKNNILKAVFDIKKKTKGRFEILFIFYYSGHHKMGEFITYAIIIQLKNKCIISCKDCSSCNVFSKVQNKRAILTLKNYMSVLSITLGKV